MTPAELAAHLDAIAARAAALRDAGVREVSIDGVAFKLAPPEAPLVKVTDEQKPQHVAVANDPSTYGLPQGAPVPGLGWADEAMRERQANRDRELGRAREDRRR